MTHTYEREETITGRQWKVYALDTYEESSVLAGRTRYSFVGAFDTEEEVLANYPNAERRSTRGARQYQQRSVPNQPKPNWFDERDAGESW